MSKEKNYFSFKNIFNFIIKVAAIIGAIGLIHGYINHLIENKINNHEFTKKIAAKIRPAVIFDSDNSILYDMGGMEFIEKIDVVSLSINANAPDKIIITPKKYMPQIPLLTCIDSVNFSVETKRIEGIKLEYVLKQYGQTGGLKKIRFRLEIM